jgi:hypothetical protein
MKLLISILLIIQIFQLVIVLQTTESNEKETNDLVFVKNVQDGGQEGQVDIVNEEFKSKLFSYSD